MAETTTSTGPEGLLGRIAGRTPTAGPEWLNGLRRRATARLEETGFPHKKVEGWRFTSVKPVIRTEFDVAEAPEATEEIVAWARARIGDDGTWQLVLVNGRPLLEGAGTPPTGVTVTSLAEALREDPASVESVLGQLAPNEYFAASNAAMFEDGVVVRFEPNAVVEQPVHLVHVAVPGSAPVAAYPRVLVLGGRTSQGRLVESYLCKRPEGGEAHLTNVVTEVDLADGAHLDHVRVQEGEEGAYHLAHLSVRQGRDSHYASRVVTFGGALCRVDLNVLLAGPGADCTLDGVYHVAGEDHVDHQTFVDHAVAHCTSRENYRGLLDGKGRAVFNGIIKVRRDAQQSSADQQNRNLLLSDDAVVNTKPHLEIDADDITASHGATIGALDEKSLFYLRTRAIGEEQARAILTFAFVQELLTQIPHGPTRHRLGERLLERLPHGDALRELV